MKLDGRRESTNVDDRRRSGGGKIAGFGLGGILIAALLTWIMGGDPLSVIQNVDTSVLNQVQTEHQITPEEEAVATFSRQVLASTEDVWTKVFQSMGREYKAPKLVLYTGSVNTRCGQGSASVGPFYCSADECLYIDLSFFLQMKKQLGADGDFAYAYVIAHEVGHHVQHLLGTLDKAHAQMQRLDAVAANKVSVRIELQADFYAGVWGFHENKMFNSLEDGDLEEAINCAEVIGDNYLQEKARGYSQPESFTHGTSQQRMRWLKRGLSSGDMNQGDTFSVPESQL
ncbi:MAG: neutral zinc metallopeptidase [Bacteroidaceae bacterium]|nr:neutral zinc metallopeptidase [Bacteroidaceae bacterium]